MYIELVHTVCTCTCSYRASVISIIISNHAGAIWFKLHRNSENFLRKKENFYRSYYYILVYTCNHSLPFITQEVTITFFFKKTNINNQQKDTSILHMETYTRKDVQHNYQHNNYSTHSVIHNQLCKNNNRVVLV